MGFSCSDVISSKDKIQPIMITSTEFPAPLNILGVPVMPFSSYEHIVGCICDRINSNCKTFCAAINPEKVYRAQHDARLKHVLNNVNIGICDGVGIVLAAKFLYNRRIMRCTGIGLFRELIRASTKEKWKVFLLGASSQSNKITCQKLMESFPELQIVGRNDGYFQGSKDIIKNINDSRADILFVAMGSPKQEFWLDRHRDEIDATFCMGVGGTFDIISGGVKQPPRFFLETGVEWLYRLITQPYRLKRQIALPLFLWLVFKKKMQ